MSLEDHMQREIEGLKSSIFPAQRTNAGVVERAFRAAQNAQRLEELGERMKENEVKSERVREVIEKAKERPWEWGEVENKDISPNTLDIQQRAYGFSSSNGYWKTFLKDNDPCPDQFPEKIAFLHDEVSEALRVYADLVSTVSVSPAMPEFVNVIQRIWYDQETGKPEGVPVELADVVIRALDMAEAFGIDLGGVILEKMEWNEQHKGRAVKEGEGVREVLS